MNRGKKAAASLHYVKTPNKTMYNFSVQEILFKETVSRDFLPSVFFIKLYPWVP
jgi:hypothetical protein